MNASLWVAITRRGRRRQGQKGEANASVFKTNGSAKRRGIEKRDGATSSKIRLSPDRRQSEIFYVPGRTLYAGGKVQVQKSVTKVLTIIHTQAYAHPTSGRAGKFSIAARITPPQRRLQAVKSTTPPPPTATQKNDVTK
ncbi:uncharacterized protein LOC126571174 isoform X2 [Anopheles aquasalis]|uniref:uncharacterized protein LOC126571174 isoform X2 n=1 Tax=Anopheles aquasalis TaxID=42839 RepID=UPI00215AE9DE|nr:uncharacterized protein LOC126571174 isoform X2 [Anopheles aquasalis]